MTVTGTFWRKKEDGWRHRFELVGEVAGLYVMKSQYEGYNNLAVTAEDLRTKWKPMKAIPPLHTGTKFYVYVNAYEGQGDMGDYIATYGFQSVAEAKAKRAYGCIGTLRVLIDPNTFEWVDESGSPE